MKPIIIIGTGLAGYTLAREFRKLNTEQAVEMFSSDEGYSYSKPMLSNAIARGQAPRDLILATPEKMADELAVTVYGKTRVLELDTSRNRINTESGIFEYSKLILATGANPIAHGIKGADETMAYSVNSLQDYERFRNAIDTVSHITIIGPGLIGCEFANDLVRANKTIAVVGPDKTPMERMLPAAAGIALQNRLSDLGINWHLGLLAKESVRQNHGYAITLSDNTTIKTDFVLSAIGLRPDLSLARAAALKVNRGLCVNQYLQTSSTSVYSLGDAIELGGLVLPFVMPIMLSAKALARTLAGKATAVSYPVMPIVVKTPAHPVVVSPPAPDATGNWNIEQLDDGSVRGLFYDQSGQLSGLALTGTATKEKRSLIRQLPPMFP